MSGSQNWGPQTTPQRYFADQAKRTSMGERRPRPAKAVDLVGPGLGATARPLTNFNDPLALFNGYFIAESGALNGPDAASAFVVHTQIDALHGGVQLAYPIDYPGVHYERTIVRGAADPDTISFVAGWRRVGAPPMASLYLYTKFGLAPFTGWDLQWGDVDASRSTSDWADWYEVSGNVLNIRKSGLYSISLRVKITEQDATWVDWDLSIEDGGGTYQYEIFSEDGYRTFGSHYDTYSFDFIVEEDNWHPVFRVQHANALPLDITLVVDSITRIGEVGPPTRTPLVITDLGDGTFNASGDGVTGSTGGTFTLSSGTIIDSDDGTYTVSSEP